jgi:uncharacterized protein (TIGR03032 family)
VTGGKADIACCPNFLRGLAIYDGFALVTVSKPRDSTFKGLLLDSEIKKRDAGAWCGGMIVNLTTGDVVQWIRLDGHITELFDVTVLPGVACPMALGPATVEIQNTITFDTVAIDKVHAEPVSG